MVSLDEHIKDRQVNFIKFDIEGSEMEALHGAREIIMKNQPQCAICVYHKLSHLWEVPAYLKTLVPEYKFYLRHHTLLLGDTVCYAVAGYA